MPMYTLVSEVQPYKYYSFQQSPRSSVVRASDYRSQGCGFDCHCGQVFFILCFVAFDGHLAGRLVPLKWNKIHTRHSISFMVDTGIWSLPITNFQWHSDPRPVEVTSQPIILSTDFMTLIPDLTLTELRVVTIEHFQRVWIANREGLPFRTPGSVPLFGGLAYSQIVETSFTELTVSFLDF